MNLKVNHIPANWQPGNHRAISEWMERLPSVRNFETIKTIDANYDKNRTAATL
ncbi:hypothetical protein [Aequorivita ciconiae]|uniref:hypothetical protein n=1 Tax=Aequorivita ciconiae TaxID=2494375 RepID=UPI0013E2B33B|nr:hypothetical protein [Aequorivita sp. H23M31]